MDAERVAELTGRPVAGLHPVGGGSICTAYRVAFADGGAAFAKTLAGAPAQFFPAESRGLRRLAAAAREGGAGHPGGGVAVPGVLAVAEDALVLDWVAPGSPSTAAAEALGRALAATHARGASRFGALDGIGFIGPLPLPAGPYESWGKLWAEGRVLPYVREARDAGALSGEDAADVERALAGLDGLPGADEPPSLIHGDLWSGNVLWGADGRPRLVDAAAVHGGHRETDLAMLALFGLPHLDAVLGAYAEVCAPPLAGGWRSRVALHQLHPVLVHAVLFGGGYGRQAGELARRIVRTC